MFADHKMHCAMLRQAQNAHDVCFVGCTTICKSADLLSGDSRPSWHLLCIDVETQRGILLMKKLTGSKLQLKRVAVGALTSATGGADGSDTGYATGSNAAPTRQAGANACQGQSCGGACVPTKQVNCVEADAKLAAAAAL